MRFRALAARPELIARIRAERAVQDPVAMGLGWAEDDLPRRIVARLGLGAVAGEQGLVDAGVCYPDTPDHPRPYTDRFRLFRHRLLLPDWRRSADASGVVFYQGRAVVDTHVKYLSPPGIPKPLVGMGSLSASPDAVWLCEGPFDVLPLIEAGQSAVATMGSTLKASLIQEFVAAVGDREVLIALDRDASGLMHAPVLLETLTRAGARARIVHPPPPYNDVGEWVVAEGVEAVIEDAAW